MCVVVLYVSSLLFEKMFILVLLCHPSSFILLQVRVIPVQLQKLFLHLLLLNQQSADVDALTTSFGWKNNEVCVCLPLPSNQSF